jgi:tetratricopeptide (TPR) repeat protein
MRRDSLAFALSGTFFGVLVGWIIGSQQARPAPPASPAVTQAPAAPAPAPPAFDAGHAAALEDRAKAEPTNAAVRAELGNLYFDAERYDDAIKWYTEALKLAPNDVNVSTDLGVCYYYVNQPDKALEQFEKSLKLDPKHAKTLLNLGIVRAFGKQDLAGASQAWQEVIKLAPDSAEAQAAKRALDSLQSAHPAVGGSQKPGS